MDKYIEVIEKILNDCEMDKLTNDELVEMAYLCNKIVDKTCNQYIGNNLASEFDASDIDCLQVEFEEMVQTEYYNECYYIYN